MDAGLRGRGVGGDHVPSAVGVSILYEWERTPRTGQARAGHIKTGGAYRAAFAFRSSATVSAVGASPSTEFLRVTSCLPTLNA